MSFHLQFLWLFVFCTILIGNEFNQLEFIIEFQNGKSFNNTEINKLSLKVSGGEEEKQFTILPRRSFPIFGKKKYLFKNKDLKKIHAEVNESETLFFTFRYIDNDFAYEDIVVKLETGWLQDGSIYKRKPKNNFLKKNKLKHMNLVPLQNDRTKIRIIFHKQNTNIKFKVVDLNNRPLDSAHIEFMKPFDIKEYLGNKDKRITKSDGTAVFFGEKKRDEDGKKEVDAQVLITKKGFLPKWLDFKVKLGVNNEKTQIVRLLKRNKAKLDNAYCSSLGMELKEGCNVCSCRNKDEIYYSELKGCDKQCMENEFPEMINENGIISVNCVERFHEMNEEVDVIPEDQKRMSVEIEFANNKPEEMTLYILEEIYDDNKFLEELGSFEDRRIGEIELINKQENSRNKIGVLNVIEDYRFEDEACVEMGSDSSDLNFVKYNTIKSPYYDISKRGGSRDCEYFYNFDASIFNHYLMTFYFLTEDNEELYKYTLYASDELYEFRDVNNLNLVFIINNNNQIELKNKDDYRVPQKASVKLENSSYQFKSKECDSNCCELINTLSLNLEECDWEASYALSQALFFDCIDEIEFEISSLKLIIKSLYKYLTDMNDNELIGEMTAINDVANQKVFIEPQAPSLLMMYFKHSFDIMKERNENFDLCDKAEIYFLKAEFYYLIAQLLLIEEREIDVLEFIIEQIDFEKNKRIVEEITIQSIIPNYTIPIKNIYFYIGDESNIYEIVVHQNNNKFDNKKNIRSIILPRFTKEVKGGRKKLNAKSAAKIAKDTYLQYKILSGNAMTIEGCKQESTYSQMNELKLISVE